MKTAAITNPEQYDDINNHDSETYTERYCLSILIVILPVVGEEKTVSLM